MRRGSNYLSYHKSITAEFKAVQDRIRYFVDDAHWGEDGSFKEILLINHLKKVLPSNVSVGTGFVRNGRELTSQIDIIIYNNSIPTLFSEGDFVIVLPESVLGIIEVKSKLNADEKLSEAIEKANRNGVTIGKNIFNGIFGYDSSIRFSKDYDLANGLKQALINNSGSLNHISFGSNYFMKYWELGNPVEVNKVSSFSFYKLRDLAFGYFISNLVHFIHNKSGGQDLCEEFDNFLFPIADGKESYRIKNLEIELY